MASTDFAALTAAAYQKLAQAYSNVDQQRAAGLQNTVRTRTSQADQNKRNVQSSSVSAADRGMLKSGAFVQQQGDIAKNYAQQVDLTNRNNASMLAAMAQKKLAARSEYDTTMANIKKQQQAAAMQSAALLPAGIDFAALKRMNGGK